MESNKHVVSFAPARGSAKDLLLRAAACLKEVVTVKATVETDEPSYEMDEAKPSIEIFWREGDYKSGIEEGWVMHIAHPLWGYLTLRIPHFGYMLKERAFTAETPLTKAVLDELADEIMAAIYEGPDALDNEWEPTMPGDGDTSGLWEAMSDWTFYSNECRQALAEWLWAELPKMLFAYPTTQSGADDDESSI
jgi:hypothetical protein